MLLLLYSISKVVVQMLLRIVQNKVLLFIITDDIILLLSLNGTQSVVNHEIIWMSVFILRFVSLVSRTDKDKPRARLGLR